MSSTHSSGDLRERNRRMLYFLLAVMAALATIALWLVFSRN
jgi:hypothetical protein